MNKLNSTKIFLCSIFALFAVVSPIFSQISSEKGSRIAKDGFRNETEILDKFNNWKNDTEAKKWLEIIGFELKNIRAVEAIKPHGKKSDLRLKITTSSGVFTEGISIKLVSNPKGFNQIDKRWVSDYEKMWEITEDIVESLKYFVGEKLPYKKSKNKKRMYLNEFDKEAQEKIISFFTKHKMRIVSDLLKGTSDSKANWFLVAQKNSSKNRWTLEHIEDVIEFYSFGDVEITRRGSLKIGAITMQRKGGDGGRETAKMLQFKLNPALLFDAL